MGLTIVSEENRRGIEKTWDGNMIMAYLLAVSHHLISLHECLQCLSSVPVLFLPVPTGLLQSIILSLN